MGTAADPAQGTGVRRALAARRRRAGRLAGDPVDAPATRRPIADAYDVVVVGSGAAGMTAAAVAAAEGLSVLLAEHAERVGGTTAISGGMVWIPDNPRLGEAGITDDRERAAAYLEATVPAGLDPALRQAFLDHGGAAVAYLEARTAVRLRQVPLYPDYYPDRPGATARGRVLEPVPFDGRALGAAFALLRPPLPEFTLFGGMMIAREDIPHLRRAGRSPRAAWRIARLVAAHAVRRFRWPRGTTLHLGNALAARLLKSVLDLGVDLRPGVSVDGLARGAGGVEGVMLGSGAGRRKVAARRGVILATGGFSHDAGLRDAHVLPQAGALSATVASGAPTGGVRLGLAAGGRIGSSAGDNAYWVPASRFTRADGTEAVFPHTVTDRGKPGLIAVDATGRRFVNEARSYHEFVLGQLRAANTAIPAHLICDRRFLWTYGLGRIRPFALSLRAELESGYLKRGRTLAALAGALGIPADALADTVDTFNADARAGVDRQFGRGGDIYQRHMGDGDHGPNPCLAPIEDAPFYAVSVWPADLGMAAGLATDAVARVLGADDAPIAGLYACGNDMRAIMNGAYPGPGITLGPAITFGYLAARHAAARPD